ARQRRRPGRSVTARAGARRRRFPCRRGCPGPLRLGGTPADDGLVTISASSTHPCRPSAARSLALACMLASLLAAALLGPTTAGAVVSEVSGTTVGLQPRNSATVKAGLFEFNEEFGAED